MTRPLIQCDQDDEPAKRQQDEAAKIFTLTETERDIITLVCYGIKDKQIAFHLGYDDERLRAHMTAIYDKLGVSNRLDLVLYAYAHSLTVLPR